MEYYRRAAAMIQQAGEYAALRLANLRLREKRMTSHPRSLTGCTTGGFWKPPGAGLNRSGRHHTGAGVIMADIDKSRLFNDSLAHRGTSC